MINSRYQQTYLRPDDYIDKPVDCNKRISHYYSFI
uniref:Uncharacterized protein n=1 Tax=Arundo donax TaxID=35708 RepID=A0A0A9AV53_ARUDO